MRVLVVSCFTLIKNEVFPGFPYKLNCFSRSINIPGHQKSFIIVGNKVSIPDAVIATLINWIINEQFQILFHRFPDIMANRGGASAGQATAQRPNGATQGKICQFKLVLLGESAVGKSSLVLRFVKGQFHEYQESTIGGWCNISSAVWQLFNSSFFFHFPAAFLTQTVCLDDTTVKFEIWDTAGQERYHSLAPMYYRYDIIIVNIVFFLND